MFKGMRKTEAAEIKRLATDLVRAGYVVSIDNGGYDWELERSTDVDEILDYAANVDNEEWFITDADGNDVGVMWLVYGNDEDSPVSNWQFELEHFSVLSRIVKG